jgi:hypothetical protein
MPDLNRFFLCKAIQGYRVDTDENEIHASPKLALSL